VGFEPTTPGLSIRAWTASHNHLIAITSHAMALARSGIGRGPRTHVPGRMCGLGLATSTACGATPLLFGAGMPATHPPLQRRFRQPQPPAATTARTCLM